VGLGISATESESDNLTPAKTTKSGTSDNFIVMFNTKSFIISNEIDKVFLNKVITHEFAHIISLQNSQIQATGIFADSKVIRDKFDIEEAKCQPNYYSIQGCFSSTSYLSQFYKQYWDGSLREEYNRIQKIQDKNEFNNQLIKWGDSHKVDFISRTAYISPEEDMAESFSIWIRNESTEKLSKTQENKIKFFNQFDSLKSIKEAYLK
jgi:hypothetical protein